MVGVAVFLIDQLQLAVFGDFNGSVAAFPGTQDGAGFFDFRHRRHDDGGFRIQLHGNVAVAVKGDLRQLHGVFADVRHRIVTVPAQVVGFFIAFDGLGSTVIIQHKGHGTDQFGRKFHALADIGDSLPCADEVLGVFGVKFRPVDIAVFFAFLFAAHSHGHQVHNKTSGIVLIGIGEDVVRLRNLVHSMGQEHRSVLDIPADNFLLGVIQIQVAKTV